MAPTDDVAFTDCAGYKMVRQRTAHSWVQCVVLTPSNWIDPNSW